MDVMSVWFGPCRKNVSIVTSRHKDYQELVRVFCIHSRRIRTYKAGEEESKVPAAWIRDHLCGECPKRKGVTDVAGDRRPGVTPPLAFV